MNLGIMTIWSAHNFGAKMTPEVQLWIGGVAILGAFVIFSGIPDQIDDPGDDIENNNPRGASRREVPDRRASRNSRIVVVGATNVASSSRPSYVNRRGSTSKLSHANRAAPVLCSGTLRTSKRLSTASSTSKEPSVVQRQSSLLTAEQLQEQSKSSLCKVEEYFGRQETREGLHQVPDGTKDGFGNTPEKRSQSGNGTERGGKHRRPKSVIPESDDVSLSSR